MRHDLLRLTAAGWAAGWAAAAAGRGPTHGLRHWAENALPVMRRRAQPGDQAGRVPVAVAFPAAFGKMRLAFQVAPADIASIAPPPPLAEVMPDLPDRFRERARAVLSLAAGMGLTPRVFGSAMWQHVTGLPYLHAQSDLDLLWDIPGGSDPAPAIAHLVASLRAIEAGPGPRLDGEIVLDRTHAVNWRECTAAGAGELLVKTGEAVMLMALSCFLQRGRSPC